jgi:tripeptide aminopeptidase
MYPEEGRSAIAAAARAIADMQLGRVDEETTANVGTIQGGTAANIVPEFCTIVAEARSHDDRKLAELVQAMQDAVTFAAGVAECEVETKLTPLHRVPLEGHFSPLLAAGALQGAASM